MGFGPDIAFDSPNAKMTPFGGLAVLLTNNSGAVSVKGKLVETSDSMDDAVELADAGAIDCIGMFLDSGIAAGAKAWVVVSGIAEVLFDDNVGPNAHDWISTGVVAGFAAAANSPAAAPTHFEEIGHCIQTVAAGGAGTHVLARCIIHFN